MEGLLGVVALDSDDALLQCADRLVDAVDQPGEHPDQLGFILIIEVRDCRFLHVQGSRQVAAVLHDRRQNLSARHVHHGQGLDTDRADVVLHHDLVTGADFRLGIDSVPDKHLHIVGNQHHLHGIRGRPQVLQPTHLRGLFDPGLVIAVAVEQNPFMLLNGVADQIVQAAVEVTLAIFQHIGKLAQGLGDSAVNHHVGTGDRVVGAHHAELELVAREGKGRGAVAIRRVAVEARQHIRAQAQALLFGPFIGAVRFDGLQHCRKFFPEEHGHDGRGRLVGAKAVVVSGRGHAHAQQALILVHGLDDGDQKEQELGVFIGRFARAQQVDPLVGRHGPVVVLAAAIDAGKGLFMQQADQIVLSGHLLHDLHGQLVVVGGDVRRGKNRCQFVLAGGDLVMLGLGIDAELPELLVQLFHEGLDPRLDGAEIVIVQLLAFRRHGAEERAAGINQVPALEVHVPVHKEILLLRTDIRDDLLDIRMAEQLQDAHGLPVQGLHAAQQRRLFIQRLAPVGAEGRRDAQGLFLDESVGGRIPGRVAARLKGGTQTAGGEAGGVRLTGDEVLSGKLHQDMAVRCRGDKAVVLLGRDAGKRLEPVGKMRCAVLDRPLAHGGRNRVGKREIQFLALADGIAQAAVHVRRESRPHDLVVKDHAPEQFRYFTHVYSSFCV